ncbi:YihY/virulence factor BrkB family protein [Adhaeribacter sp. BT258]|uniref:YihY/virulence factor BrkB family protein n=1 Tax=Adhaeribacter terrigena TaxID=2793070 RepID=A0ABS1C4E5_9BACT|nr:YihY/virulence factor BrkB family protein [Adhaeribacter terrigena]MBK0403503.1 YihY/virulence factor BrkB family protein [Adhaeribacter terrigena]
MIRKILKDIWCLFRETWLEFMDVNPFQMGAALAYYAVFALPPMIIIILNSAGLFYGKKAVEGEIYVFMRDYIGADGALEVQKMVENLSQNDGLTLATLIGLGALLIAATGVFISLQDSLNFIWGVKPKPKNEYLKLLLDRLTSFAMILGMAPLVLATVFVQGALSWLGNQIFIDGSTPDIFMASTINLVVSTMVIAFLFGAIYKFLPDARIHWRDVRVGAGVTAALFTIGKMIIAAYVTNSNIASIYGAAGIIAILLVWVFYSSQILFFGAVFTLVYSRKYGSNIYPRRFAVHVRRTEVEVGRTAVNKEKGKYEQGDEDYRHHNAD